MAIPVGSALGYVLGEQVAGSWLGWRWAFYLVVLPGVGLGLWSFFKREAPRGQTDLACAMAPGRVAWKDYLVLARTPSYVLNTCGMCAMTFAIGGIVLGYFAAAKYVPAARVALREGRTARPAAEVSS